MTPRASQNRPPEPASRWSRCWSRCRDGRDGRHGLAGRGRHRARAHCQPRRLEQTLRLNTVLAQWQTGPAVGAGHRRRAGAGVRRRHAAHARAAARAACRSSLVAARAALGAGPARGHAAPRLQDSWLPASSCRAAKRASCACSTACRSGRSYFFRGNAWSNAQSSRRRGAAPRRPGAGAAAAALPTGVRVVLAFAGGSGRARNLTRDPCCGRRRHDAAAARAQQAGAALLTAMIIVTLVATLAASMVWQQWRAVQVEAAERARTQSAWILAGALDWARLILREDARSGGADHLGEPWAVPLAEARLSTFLAADRQQHRRCRPTPSCRAPSATRRRATTCATCSTRKARSRRPNCACWSGCANGGVRDLAHVAERLPNACAGGRRSGARPRAAATMPPLAPQRRAARLAGHRRRHRPSLEPYVTCSRCDTP